MTYRIVIPSYRRENAIKRKTLALLERHGVPGHMVTVYVANHDELGLYQRSLAGGIYTDVQVSAPGLVESRQYISMAHPEGTALVWLDDDLDGVKAKHADGKVRTLPPGHLEHVFQRGFNLCRRYGATLWGVKACSHTLGMNHVAALGLFYVIGSMYGTINTHEPAMQLPITARHASDKEDYERTLRHYQRDGRVVRMEDVSLVSSWYTLPGGLQDVDGIRPKERVAAAANAIAATWPQWVRTYTRRTTGFAELKLRAPNPRRVAMEPLA